MIKQLLWVLACFLPLPLFAQSWAARNALYADIGDIYQLNYSVNYGRILYQKNSFSLSASAGVSVEPVDYSSFWQPLFPLEITVLTGQRKHHLEGGIFLLPGVYYSFEIHNDYLIHDEPVKEITDKAFGTTAGLRLGYRFQKPGGGFFFRAGFTPVLYSSFTPFYLTYVDAGKDGCPVCVFAMPSGRKTGLVPGISFSLGRSF